MNKEQAFLTLINLTKNLSFGTLWWVKDTLWKEVKPNFCIKTEKKRHPGCSLGKKKSSDAFTSLNQTFFMLLGSHSHSKCFEVEGLNEKVKSSKSQNKGGFAIRPYNIAIYHLIGKDPGIAENIFKPTLTDLEKKQLKKYLKNRGIEIYE